jgi:hypothetical protein
MDVSSGAQLEQLKCAHPKLWATVLQELSQYAHAKNWSAIAAMQVSSKGSTAPQSAPLIQMRRLAAEQFTQALTVAETGKPNLVDRILFEYLFYRLRKCEIPTDLQFDNLWKRLKNPSWAARELQNRGVWSVPTQNLLDRIVAQIQNRFVLELGCGRGLLTAGLALRGVQVIGCDNGSWQSSKKVVKEAAAHCRNREAAEALEVFKPSVVLCFWPPPQNDFESRVFKTPSVELYLTVQSQYTFASGNQTAYRTQTKFVASESPVLNALIRPIESAQRLLIFRRISD